MLRVGLQLQKQLQEYIEHFYGDHRFLLADPNLHGVELWQTFCHNGDHNRLKKQLDTNFSLISSNTRHRNNLLIDLEVFCTINSTMNR